ncbi:thioesterase family protein [Actinomycetospora sp. TBRC 11914]|uniref:thioesterase family protein n=1 Tax=Actinomycetospora sp. TBRC 11914 TaxID=2729387 RepID=UPI00145C6DA1|nr:thioesterase [Actinomycetospora sp. TBRC 11914]NMO93044.1 thioesterase [Actinomycetospora sp. TBRC 11914]
MLHDVTDEDTAIALGSGDVAVLGTPRLVAWLEAATVATAEPLLDEGRTTVGTAVRVKHRRPTLVGGTIGCTAEVTSGPDEKGRITFAVRAVDGEGQVAGEGEIDRVVVDRGAFGT